MDSLCLAAGWLSGPAGDPCVVYDLGKEMTWLTISILVFVCLSPILILDLLRKPETTLHGRINSGIAERIAKEKK